MLTAGLPALIYHPIQVSHLSPYFFHDISEKFAKQSTFHKLGLLSFEQDPSVAFEQGTMLFKILRTPAQVIGIRIALKLTNN